MSKIAVSYDDLQDVDPGYVQRLKEKEEAVQRAMANIARYTSVRWMSGNDSEGTLSSGCSPTTEATASRFSPLDLTLESDAFEELITEGRRARR